MLIQGILPPFMLERMAQSPSAHVRQAALANIAASAASRARRETLGLLPSMGMLEAPMATCKRWIFDVKHRTRLPGVQVRIEGQDPVADLAVNEAYDYSGMTFDFYRKLFDRNSLDQRGMALISSVHYMEHYSNAFFDGRQMVYGDGDGEVFVRFTKAIEVVGHELTHGVVAASSNLAYHDEPGALNEHFADVMGTLIRQWHRSEPAATASWLIGEELLVPARTRRALRDMAHPGTAYRDDPHLGSDPQPSHMREKYEGGSDNGGVHINSGIPNLVFYRVAQALGGYAWEKAGTIWYQAMLQLSPESRFSDCARITLQIASATYGATGSEQAAVKEAWKSVGVE